jgi:hypothetical protein
MNNMYVSKSSITYDSVEKSYSTIREALTAKPKLLQAILKSAQLEAHNDAVTSLKTEEVIQAGIPAHLVAAEKVYQKTLNLQAAQLLKLYANLPIDRKIDLLAYAEEIGDINDKTRKLANQQMRTNLVKTVATHLTKVEHHPVATSPHTITNKDNLPAALTQAATKPLPAPSAEGLALEPPQEQGLINQIGLGSPVAVTVNLPFTAIPGLPSLSKILEKIDRTTHFDLGFTIKGVADRAPNPGGKHDILYRLSYAGAGIMSSKFNVQIAPIALKVQESVDQDKWGGNSSILTKHKTDNSGEKFSINFNDNDGSASYAHEYTYQKPSNKIISTLTGGHNFSRETSPSLRIPAELIPTLDRIVKALPNQEEANVIFDRIDKVVPVNQVIKIASSVIDNVDRNIINELPTLTASMHLLKQTIAESGISARAQAEVLARAYENYDKNATQGSLPALNIQEKSDSAQTTFLDR